MPTVLCGPISYNGSIAVECFNNNGIVVDCERPGWIPGSPKQVLLTGRTSVATTSTLTEEKLEARRERLSFSLLLSYSSGSISSSTTSIFLTTYIPALASSASRQVSLAILARSFILCVVTFHSLLGLRVRLSQAIQAVLWPTSLSLITSPATPLSTKISYKYHYGLKKSLLLELMQTESDLWRETKARAVEGQGDQTL